LRGQVCLFFTDLPDKKLNSFLTENQDPDYAKAGTKALYTVFLEKGTKALDAYGHGLEPHFRKLGLPTKLNMQKIELLADTFVCKEGEEINVE